jgi:hypothetical protein
VWGAVHVRVDPRRRRRGLVLASRRAPAPRGGHGAIAVDLPGDDERAAHERPEAEIVFGERCDFDTWPAVPIHVIASRDDRFFPIDFQRRVARELDEPIQGRLSKK